MYCPEPRVPSTALRTKSLPRTQPDPQLPRNVVAAAADAAAAAGVAAAVPLNCVSSLML